MLIASRIQRPTAPIELKNGTYFFTPINPHDPSSEHVAEVTDPDDMARLLAIPEGYYLSRNQELKSVSKPTPKPPTEPPAVPVAPVVPPAGPTDPTTPSGLTEELEQAAVALNALSWQGLNAELKKEGIPEVVIQRALEIEGAKPDIDQRETTIRILKKKLGIQ